MSDPVAQLHERVYARTVAESWFEDIFLLLNETGVLLKDIETKLKVFKSTNGKSGMAVVFDRPLRDVTAPDMPGPEWVVRIPVTAYEFEIINRGSGGSGKQIEEVVSKLAAILHHFFIQHLGTTVYLDTQAVTPFAIVNGVIVSEMSFRATLNQQPEEKVGAPKVDGTLDAVTILAGAAFSIVAGADVYYTTDGSYPTPTNGTFYGTVILSEAGAPILTEDGEPLTAENAPDPFAVAAGTLVLANAWKDGMQHSDLAGKQF